MRKSRPNPLLAAEVDTRLSMRDHVEALSEYRGGWIRTTRHALGWVLEDLGAKVALSNQAVSRLEVRERHGRISIRKLDELAQAMNCRLVYGFVPEMPMAVTAQDLLRRQTDARRRKRRMPRPE